MDLIPQQSKSQLIQDVYYYTWNSPISDIKKKQIEEIDLILARGSLDRLQFTNKLSLKDY